MAVARQKEDGRFAKVLLIVTRFMHRAALNKVEALFSQSPTDKDDDDIHKLTMLLMLLLAKKYNGPVAQCGAQHNIMLRSQVRILSGLRV